MSRPCAKLAKYRSVRMPPNMSPWSNAAATAGVDADEALSSLGDRTGDDDGGAVDAASPEVAVAVAAVLPRRWNSATASLAARCTSGSWSWPEATGARGTWSSQAESAKLRHAAARPRSASMAASWALEDFEQRESSSSVFPLAIDVVAEDAMSATSEPSAASDDDAVTSSSSTTDADEEASPFELDVVSDMGWSLYYASLAEGLLMEPPASGASSDDDDDAIVDSSDIADVSLWSY